MTKNIVVQLEQYPDALILTVTRRLALRIEQSITKQNQLVMMQPVYAIQDWFYNLYQDAGLSVGMPTQILNPLQEQALWLNQILQTTQGHDLLKPMQTAKQLMQTWKLLCEWRLQAQDLDWGDGQEQTICSLWIESFEQALNNQNLITRSQIPNLLLDFIQNNQPFSQLNIPYKTIVLSGFDDFTPQIKAWIEYFKSNQIEVLVPTYSQQAQVQRYTFEDPNQELHYIAKNAFEWANQHPGKSIGIVVPDLVKTRAAVEQVFNQICDPKACTAPDTQVSWQFNISAGLPISRYPIVQALMLSFKLLQDDLELALWLHCLQSPFFTGTATKSAMTLQFQLQNLKQRYITYEDVIHLAKDIPNELNWLSEIQSFKHKFKQKLNLNGWLNVVVEWIKHLGWPGPRRLNSPEHQVMARFYSLLKEWTSTTDKAMVWQEAVTWLKAICLETTFQPESHPVQIQIMGLLEAAGQSFDMIWVMGLNSETWPAKPAPDPFIPYPVQLEHQMPHSTPSRELVFAQNLIDNLVNSAPLVNFSYAKTSQAKVYSPSPIIERFPESIIESSTLAKIERKLASKDDLQLTPKPQSIPLKQERVRGGVWLIQDQSQCPFKAFAKYRLHLEDLRPMQNGINPLIRGQLLHHALAELWDKLEDWHQLQQLTDSQLADLIDETLMHITKAYPLPSFYSDIEIRRLKTVINSWMALEKTRHPFKVAKTEANAQIHLEGMTLNCRLDRVDIDEAGRFIIIDYKTGHVNLKDCFSQRPDAPQLPLYCFANFPRQTNAIVYAQIKRDSCQFIGISEASQMLPNVSTIDQLKLEDIPGDWQSALSEWRHTLNAIAHAFMSGHNLVSPKSPTVCRYCHLASFCRIKEGADV